MNKEFFKESYTAMGRGQGVFTAVVFAFVLWVFAGGYWGAFMGIIYGLCVVAYGASRYFHGASVAYGDIAKSLQESNEALAGPTTWDDIADMLRDRGYKVTHD